MQSFQLIKPCLALAPYIRHYWILQDDSVTPVSERTLPIGCMQLVFHKGKQLLLSGESELQPQSFISGQSVGFSDVQSTGRIEMITVVFQPYAVKALFHIPSHLFHGQNVDTDAMEDVELSDLVKQVTDTSDNAVSIRLIEQFFLRRLYTLPEYNLKRMSAVFHEINLQPQINIAHLSETACLSSKQFGRIFADYVGTTPKEFIRIIRMQAGIVNVAAGCHYPFCTSSLRMWLLRSVSHDKGIQTLFRLHPCRVSFCLRSLFRLFFRTLKMSLFSYQASSCCPTFAVSLQRLSSNDKKETK